MRKLLLLLLLASILLPGAATAQYDVGYVAFYADMGRSTNCISSESIPSPPANVVNVYIYGAAGALGLHCAEFQVNFPANTSIITILNGPDVNLTFGDLETGIAISTASCNNDWTLLLQVIMYVTDENQTALSFAPSGVSGFLVICNCQSGYPRLP
jgi:hypothetical protein